MLSCIVLHTGINITECVLAVHSHIAYASLLSLPYLNISAQLHLNQATAWSHSLETFLERSVYLGFKKFYKLVICT